MCSTPDHTKPQRPGAPSRRSELSSGAPRSTVDTCSSPPSCALTSSWNTGERRGSSTNGSRQRSVRESDGHSAATVRLAVRARSSAAAAVQRQGPQIGRELGARRSVASARSPARAEGGRVEGEGAGAEEVGGRGGVEIERGGERRAGARDPVVAEVERVGGGRARAGAENDGGARVAAEGRGAGRRRAGPAPRGAAHGSPAARQPEAPGSSRAASRA